MSSNKYLNILIYILLLVFVFTFSFLARSYYDSLHPRINSLFVDGDCSVAMSVGNTRRHINFGRNVIDFDCYDLVDPAISDDGMYATFENRLVLEGGVNANSVFIYEFSVDMWFKVYDYGSEKLESLSFDKDNNLQIKLASGTKIVTRDEYGMGIAGEDKKVLRLVKERPEVKAWLGDNENRYVEIIDVNDSTVQVRVYEYFEKDNRTKTFNWYEYDRLTGKITRGVGN